LNSLVDVQVERSAEQARLASPPVRYLAASDLHYGLEQLDWIATQAASFDAVVLGGDHLDVVGGAELNVQIALMTAYLARLADRTTVVANSGNHDLTARRADGEKAAMWMQQLDPRVMTDGDTIVLARETARRRCRPPHRPALDLGLPLTARPVADLVVRQPSFR
jgi:predicted MPP superfamily phosphohydrolase